jgi:hypothetical protein
MYSKAFNEPLIKSTEFNTVARALPTPVRSNSLVPINSLSRSPGSNSVYNTEKFGFPGMDDLHKVEVSSDGQRLFTGGKGLHRFDASTYALRPIEIDTTKGT